MGLVDTPPITVANSPPDAMVTHTGMPAGVDTPPVASEDTPSREIGDIAGHVTGASSKDSSPSSSSSSSGDSASSSGDSTSSTSTPSEATPIPLGTPSEAMPIPPSLRQASPLATPISADSEAVKDMEVSTVEGAKVNTDDNPSKEEESESVAKQQSTKKKEETVKAELKFMFNVADGGFTELHNFWAEEKTKGFSPRIWGRHHDYWLLKGLVTYPCSVCVRV